MNVKSLVLVGALALVASPVVAADLVNEDAITHEVQLDDGKEVRTLSIKAGETIVKVCEECVITVGDSSLDADRT